MLPLESIPGICELELVSAPGAATPRGAGEAGGLLIEVPHGATETEHFDATRSRLAGEFPDDLVDFFHVNTDVGSIECARWIARMVTDPSAFPELGSETSRRTGLDRALIVRGLVARTFVDLNRVLRLRAAGKDARGGLTPGLPAYVTEPEDRETLRRMHRAYQELAERAYGAVLGEPGERVPASPALIVHTFAPRTVSVETVDRGIVAALRAAYEPSRYATLPMRPEVELITETADGTRLAPQALARDVRSRYQRIGVRVAENATYRLHSSSVGYRHSVRYPGRVLSLEIRRDLLVDAYTPFDAMSVSEARARRMAAPIAAACLDRAEPSP